jgi:hypothetical protein
MRLVLLVGLGIAEIGYDGRYRLGTGPLEGINPKQQLHKVIIGPNTDGLYDIDIEAPNRFASLDIGIPSENVMVCELDRLIPRKSAFWTRSLPGAACEYLDGILQRQATHLTGTSYTTTIWSAICILPKFGAS